jgi:PAS domain S-box-containing protein
MDKLPEENTPSTLRELILETQLELSPSGITVNDVNERIVFWNKRFLETWGLTADDLRTLERDVVVEKVISKIRNVDEFQKTLSDAYSDQEYQGTDHIELLDGTHLERKTVSLKDKEGRYHGRIWYFTDITQQKSREEEYENYASQLRRMVANRTQELIEAERMAASGTLASEIAHDLKSPLQSIRNAAFMIKRAPERIDVGLEIIEKSVMRSIDMLDEMRSSTRKAEPHLVRTNLNQLIKDAIDELPRPDHISVQMEMDAVEDAWIDSTQIRRVLDNVLLNAVEAMPNGGVISITKHFVEGKFIIQISDTGIGIPVEVLPNLFERKFYTTKPHGLGLGLSYCKRTLESHGGSIMVDSVLGKGTIFTIEIPLID